MIYLQIVFYDLKKEVQEFDGCIQNFVQKVVDSKKGFVNVACNLTILEGSEKIYVVSGWEFYIGVGKLKTVKFFGWFSASKLFKQEDS